MENWRDIPGFEGLYQASDHGRIRSLDRQVRTKGGTTRMSRGSVLRSYKDARYEMVLLSVDGARHTGMVHRLVCSAFHGAPSLGMQAAHYDGNCFHNVPENLRWATAKENCADRKRHGTWVHGTSVNTNKLCEKDVLAIRARLKNGESTKELASAYSVHRSSIQQIMRGATWKHLLT